MFSMFSALAAVLFMYKLLTPNLMLQCKKVNFVDTAVYCLSILFDVCNKKKRKVIRAFYFFAFSCLEPYYFCKLEARNTGPDSICRFRNTEFLNIPVSCRGFNCLILSHLLSLIVV